MANQQPTILIIEDEQTLLDMYRMKFTASGFAFAGALTGEAGLELAAKTTPAAVLVDLILGNKAAGGVMNGYEVIKKLRKGKDTKHIKICALTNFDQDKNIEKAYTAGADDYLVKSDLTPAELVNKVRDLLAGKKVGLKKSYGK